jgi:hypothetical protein
MVLRVGHLSSRRLTKDNLVVAFLYPLLCTTFMQVREQGIPQAR